MYSTRISQRIRAPRSAVYRMLLDPHAVAKWRVPNGMSSHVHQFDAREGGSFRITLRYDAPTGTGKTEPQSDTYHGQFVKLVPDELVVEVSEFETADADLRGEMTMTTTLTDADGGTDVVIVHDGIPDSVPAADNETGTRMALENLARLVEARRPSVGSIGIWTRSSNLNADVAREVESMGYGAIWIGGSPGGELRLVDELLAATERLVVATGIVRIWTDDATTIAAAHHRITGAFPDRFLLGIGAGHPEFIGGSYRHPYRGLVDYLDVLDAEGVPRDERVLAALGPKVLALARDRAAGAHPYLTTPQHTRQARELLGPDALLAPEQKIVIEADSDRARTLARKFVSKPYLELTNYVASLRRLGWGDDDFASGGSDALIDALVGHGDARTAATRVHEHLDAGADHVAIQLLAEDGADPLDGYRRLARALTA